jgi:hypothetical protein
MLRKTRDSDAVLPPDQRFFFVHLMKTGGTTLWAHACNTFDPKTIYPILPDERDENGLHAYLSIPRLMTISPGRRARIRFYSGHFPFIAVDLVGQDAVTITIVRDPVDRTISHLRQRRRLHAENRGQSLEEVYEDPAVYGPFIANHQTKMLSMTRDDPLVSLMDIIDVDDRRLEMAKAALDRVDVLGITPRHHDVLDELRARYGWRIEDSVRDFGVSRPVEIPASFRRRIAVDNAADVELYAHACALVHRRRRARRTFTIGEGLRFGLPGSRQPG